MTDYEIEYQNNPAACGEPFPEVAAFFEKYLGQSARVLDLGCGQGRDALLAARHGHVVDGVDISPTGIAQMLHQARAENLRVNGEVADLLDYLPRTEYDVVLLDRVVHMLMNPEAKGSLLEKAKRATAKGGFVLIVDTPGNVAGIEYAFREADKWSLVFKTKGFRFYQKAASSQAREAARQPRTPLADAER